MQLFAWWLSLITLQLFGLYGLFLYGYLRVRRRDIERLRQVTPEGIIERMGLVEGRMEQVEDRMERHEEQTQAHLNTMVAISVRVENVIPHLDGAVRMMTRVSENVTLVGIEVRGVVERMELSQGVVEALAARLERLSADASKSSNGGTT